MNKYYLFIETTDIEIENFILNKVEEIFPEFKPFRTSGNKADGFEFYDTNISYEKILEVSKKFHVVVFTLREDKVQKDWWPTNFCYLINENRTDIQKEFDYDLFNNTKK
jgi:hypothetical protein